jgi:hypothetical protein
LPALVGASPEFSGAEIEEAIISALYDAFYEKKALATEHVLAALAATVPLAKTMAEKITAQRRWANGRARNASVPQARNYPPVNSVPHRFEETEAPTKMESDENPLKS